MGKYVSDVVVDVLTDLGCRYLPLNPGSSFRGLHDSLVNHPSPASPEIILCTHEEIAVAAAHAYAKATGQIGYAVVHNLVGLMHASMAVYDAWADRTPLVILGGGGPADPAERRPIDWFHSATTQSGLVRPFVKWDDDPVTPQATIDSIIQAHRMAGSAPTGPTYVTLDAALQEQEDPGVSYRLPADPHAPPFVARPEDLNAAATILLEADFPLIVAGGVGLDPRSTAPLVELMELLGGAGRDERNLTALPTRHPLCFNGDNSVIHDADVVLAVDMHDIRWLLARSTSSPRIIDLSARSLAMRPWSNVGFMTDDEGLMLVSDPIEGLIGLIGAVRSLIETDNQSFTERRVARLEALADRRQALDSQRAEALSRGWNDRPIAIGRLVSEVHAAARDEPWLLVLRNTRSWPEGVWEFDRAGRYLGHSGGGGMGYGPGALLGGGLAARDRGALAVGIIGDGDLMFAPGAIWSAVHHGVPVLVVVNNNQTYLNDEHHQDQIAQERGRPREYAHIGTAIGEPGIAFAGLARSLGAWAEGPITDPGDLGPVLQRAVEQVRAGKVAVVDVHTAK